MKQRLIALSALLLLAAALAGCAGSSAGKLNNEGNDAFAKEAYEEAWARYQAAQNEAPSAAEPYYNAANTLYRQGDYAAALEQMNLALSFVEDEQLASDSFFNLGNASLNLQDAAAAVEAYKQALLRDPADMDAKVNLELALAQLQQQQNQQQQNEEQQQEQQQEQDQQQQDQQGQGEQQQDQQNPGEGEQQNEGEQPSDQQQQQEQGGEQQGEQQQQPGDQQGEQEQQQEGEQSPDGQQERPGQDGQADSQLSEGEPNQDSGYSMMPEPGQRLSADQARQMLAAIGRGSQTLQQALGQIFGGGNRPPAQDW